MSTSKQALLAFIPFLATAVSAAIALALRLLGAARSNAAARGLGAMG